ncbi:MAG: TIGR00730 family Rossman fold protein [Pseudomonadota bacterium]
MTDIQNVCVYCGSSSNVDDVYKEAAKTLGHHIADAGWGVVYGGGRVGLMGIVADSALEKNGPVIGIIPEHIQEREVQHKDLTELHVVDTMHVRKQMMVDRSQAFVILPGGLGTLDEFFELITWKQLGLHDKPIVVANIEGYWTKMLDSIDNIANVGFMREEDKDLFVVVEKVEDIVDALKNAPNEKFDPTTKWI